MEFYFDTMLFNYGFHTFWQVGTLLLFVRSFPRKNNFWLRFLAFIAVTLVYLLCVVFAMAFLIGSSTSSESMGWIAALGGFVVQFLFLLLFYLGCRFMFFIDRKQLCLVVLSAYACENISTNVYELIVKLFIGETVFPLYPFRDAWEYAVYIFAKVAVICFIYFLVWRKLAVLHRKVSTRNVVCGDTIILFVFFIVFANIFCYNIIFTFASEIFIVQIFLSVLSIVLCGFLFFAQYNYLETDILKEEQETLNQMRTEEREQYAISEQTIDTINRKSHDLKHQLNTIQQQGGQNNGFVDETISAIRTYESVFRTGNGTIDVMLSEHALRCKERNILLLVMLDGASLGFINEYDLNSIFGNLLGNAVEYLSDNVEDAEKKFIRVKGGKRDSGVFLSVENYLEGAIEFGENALPKTTKGGREVHGYGLHSVREIVKSYGGVMSIETEDSLFKVKIFFVDK